MKENVDWEQKCREQTKKVSKLKRLINELLKAGDDFAASASVFEAERWQELSRRIKTEAK